MSDEHRRGLDIPVRMPLPFNTNNMLSVNVQGTRTANETYVAEHDILNCVPACFVGLCTLIQNVDLDVATQKFNISEEDMAKAFKALQFVFSREATLYQTPEELYKASGILDCTWEARTWILKNFADVMIRMWHQAALARVNNAKQYADFPIHMAAEAALRSFGKGL